MFIMCHIIRDLKYYSKVRGLVASAGLCSIISLGVQQPLNLTTPTITRLALKCPPDPFAKYFRICLMAIVFFLHFVQYVCNVSVLLFKTSILAKFDFASVVGLRLRGAISEL